MEKKSEQELSTIISRVMTEVNREVKNYDPGFKISDFRDHVGELGKAGGLVAWTISYSTAKSGIEKIGDTVAWTISYSTSKSAIEKVGGLES